MRVKGPSLDDLTRAGDEFSALVERGIDQAARVAAKDLKTTWTGDDLAVIKRVFDQYTIDTLLPELRKQYEAAVTDQADRIQVAAGAVTAAVVLPTPPSILADNYLSTASNRLKGISDEVWQATRTELVTGMNAGESIPQLRKRVMQAADVSKARATTIARTEVIGAQNRGSLNQVVSAGYPGDKTWLSAGDDKVRPSHRISGQTVRIPDKFSVGGVSMDGPHDPSAPPGETINCRCTLTYDLDEQPLADAQATDWTELTGEDAIRRFFPQIDEATQLISLEDPGLGGMRFYDLDKRHGLVLDPGDRPFDQARVDSLLQAAQRLIRTTHPATDVRILVTDLTELHQGALGLTRLHDTQGILLSDQLLRSRFPESATEAVGQPGFWMPAAEKATAIEYVLAHEYGHAITPTGREWDEITAYRDESRDSMSTYGRRQSSEAFAEAWAEWYLTKGATTNPAALKWAAIYGWEVPK